MSRDLTNNNSVSLEENLVSYWDFEEPLKYDFTIKLSLEVRLKRLWEIPTFQVVDIEGK